jgi:hypothetical protein
VQHRKGRTRIDDLIEERSSFDLHLFLKMQGISIRRDVLYFQGECRDLLVVVLAKSLPTAALDNASEPSVFLTVASWHIA